MQQPGRALLGHPQTRQIKAEADTDIPGAVWCRPYGSSYATPTEDGDSREDDGVSPYTAILPVELRNSVPMVYGQPVQTVRMGGRLVIIGTMPKEGNAYTGSEPLQPASPPVERQQIQWLTVIPNSTPDMGLFLIGGVVRVGNALRSIPNMPIPAADLSPLLSGLTAGQAKAVLVAVDTSDMSIVLTAGSAFEDNMIEGVSDHHALFANYPQTLSSEDVRAFTLVKLYYGMSEIVTEGLYPLLDPGDGGGSGGDTTWMAGGTADRPAAPGDLIGFWDYETGDVWMRNGSEPAGWLGPYNLTLIGSGGSDPSGVKVEYQPGSGWYEIAHTEEYQVVWDAALWDTDGYFNGSFPDLLTVPEAAYFEVFAWVELIPLAPTSAGFVRAWLVIDFAEGGGPGSGENGGKVVQYIPASIESDIEIQVSTKGNIGLGSPEVYLYIYNTTGVDLQLRYATCVLEHKGPTRATP